MKWLVMIVSACCSSVALCVCECCSSLSMGSAAVARGGGDVLINATIITHN